MRRVTRSQCTSQVVPQLGVTLLRFRYKALLAAMMVGLGADA